MFEYTLKVLEEKLATTERKRTYALHAPLDMNAYPKLRKYDRRVRELKDAIDAIKELRVGH